MYSEEYREDDYRIAASIAKEYPFNTDTVLMFYIRTGRDVDKTRDMLDLRLRGIIL